MECSILPINNRQYGTRLTLTNKNRQDKCKLHLHILYNIITQENDTNISLVYNSFLCS